MTTGIMQCDSCMKLVKEEIEAMGWLRLQTIVVPTPKLQKLVQQQGGMDGENEEVKAELPPVVGGDFCSIDCLTSFAESKKDEVEKKKREKLAKEKGMEGVEANKGYL